MKRDFSIGAFPELKNAQPATLEMLKSSGEINHGTVFAVGDKIEIPETIKDENLKYVPVRNTGFKAIQVSAYINGKPGWLPVGTLRRRPVDADDNLKAFKVNYELFKAANDFDRCAMIAGKTLNVTKVEEFDFPRYDNNGSMMYTDDGRIAVRKARLPIFELS